MRYILMLLVVVLSGCMGDENAAINESYMLNDSFNNTQIEGINAEPLQGNSEANIDEPGLAEDRSEALGESDEQVPELEAGPSKDFSMESLEIGNARPRVFEMISYTIRNNDGGAGRAHGSISIIEQIDDKQLKIETRIFDHVVSEAETFHLMQFFPREGHYAIEARLDDDSDPENNNKRLLFKVEEGSSEIVDENIEGHIYQFSRSAKGSPFDNNLTGTTTTAYYSDTVVLVSEFGEPQTAEVLNLTFSGFAVGSLEYRNEVIYEIVIDTSTRQYAWTSGNSIVWVQGSDMQVVREYLKRYESSLQIVTCKSRALIEERNSREIRIGDDTYNVTVGRIDNGRIESLSIAGTEFTSLKKGRTEKFSEDASFKVESILENEIGEDQGDYVLLCVN
ncbi:MAG: hypothetical protein ABH879_08545 [archaeon]